MPKQVYTWGKVTAGDIISFRYKGKKETSTLTTLLVLNPRMPYTRKDNTKTLHLIGLKLESRGNVPTIKNKTLVVKLLERFGQIQVVGCEDAFAAKGALLEAKDGLIEACNEVDPILVKFGGGCRDLEARVIDTKSGPMVIAHILVDCRDAMGANAVNTMAETIAPRIEAITGGTVILRIISNLAVHRLARVSAVFTPEEMSDAGDADQGAEVIDGILQAYHFAAADPFRATTHNKGIMNAISPIGVACGQDWRAIESGAHSFASYERTYGSLTHWEKDGEGNLVGSIELPMPGGLVGGAVRVHPGAKANVAIMGARNADDLAKVMAAAGLAQNLGALRALATVGIQAGHMKLHARNMAVTAGAEDHEVDVVVEMIQSSGQRITAATIENALKELREG